MANNEIGGTAYVKIDGRQYNFRASLKINHGGKVRTPVMGGDGRLHGYTTKYEPATAELQISDTGDLSMASLRAIENSTFTAEMGNGKTYIIPASMQIDSPDLDNDAGQITMKFAGQAVTEILASAI